MGRGRRKPVGPVVDRLTRIAAGGSTGKWILQKEHVMELLERLLDAMRAHGGEATKADRPATPEMDRAIQAEPNSRLLMRFLTWLDKVQGTVLCEERDVETRNGPETVWAPIPVADHERLVADFQGIDLLKVAQERAATVEWANQVAAGAPDGGRSADRAPGPDGHLAGGREDGGSGRPGTPDAQPGGSPGGPGRPAGRTEGAAREAGGGGRPGADEARPAEDGGGGLAGGTCEAMATKKKIRKAMKGD